MADRLFRFIEEIDALEVSGDFGGKLPGMIQFLCPFQFG